MSSPSLSDQNVASALPSQRRLSASSFQSSAGLAVAALTGLTLAFCHGLWLPGLVLIKRDAFRYFLPLKQYVVERLAAGELPQWFPYEALGCAFIGVSGMGIFHPFTALYIFFSVPDAYRASTLLSCLLAAFGAFALGRTLNFSRAGALLAGIAFSLSGYVVSLTENRSEEHTSELQSQSNLVCRLLLEKKKKTKLR